MSNCASRRDRRNFISSVLWQGCAAILLALRGLLSLVIVAKLLGAESYGLFSQFSTTLTLIAPTLTLYLDAGLARYLAGEPDEQKVSGQYFAVLLAVAALAVIAAAWLGWGGAGQLSLWVWGEPTYTTYARWLALALVPTAVNLVALALFQARQEFRSTVGIQVGKSFAQIVLAFLAAVTGRGVLGAVMGIAAMELVFLLLMLGLAIARVGRPRVDFRALPGLLRYSLPLLPANLALWLMSTGSRYILVRYLSLQEIGVYAASFTLGSMAGLFVNPITYVLLPTVSAQWRSGRAEEAVDLVAYASRLFLALAIPSGMGLVVLSRPLLEAAATESFAAGAVLVLPVALGTVAMGIFRLRNMLLHLEERTGQIALMLLVGLGVNLCLTAGAVPRFGAVGAAWSFALSYGLIALWNVGLYWRTEHRRGFRRRAVFGLKCAVAAGGMSAAMMALLALFPAPRALSLLAAVCAGSIAYALGLWVTRAYDADELAQLKGLLGRFRRQAEVCTD